MTNAEFEYLLHLAKIHECADDNELHGHSRRKSAAKSQHWRMIAWCGSDHKKCCCEGADKDKMSLWLAGRNMRRHPLLIGFNAVSTRSLARFSNGQKWKGAFSVRSRTLRGPGIDTVPSPEPIFTSNRAHSDYEVFEIEGSVQPAIRLIGDTYGIPSSFNLDVRLDLKYARERLEYGT